MREQQMLLEHVIVDGILDEYTHEIKFNKGNNYAIIYGPNGVGKTKLLEIIKAASELQYDTLMEMPFRTAKLTYSDSTVLRVTREAVYEEEEGYYDYKGTFELTLPDGKVATWSAVTDHDGWHRSKHDAQYLHGEIQTAIDDNLRVAETSKVSTEHWSFFSHDKDMGKAPKVIRSFKEKSHCYLIEAQRLKTPRKHIENRQRRLIETREPEDRIVALSRQIAQLLNEAQTKHSQLSRIKERTFPSRVLAEAQKNIHIRRDAEKIRKQYNMQNEFRDRLAKVVSDDYSEGLALPDGELEDWALTLLELYLDDAKDKLRPFVEILGKIELLQELVNKRLLNKALFVTEKRGLIVKRTDRNEEIPLTALSSGEQHQIILLCDLLLNVREGSLVLIDEPEISLHIAWQLDFIPDVIAIAEMVGFRFIVATHSPQIINGLWREAIQLGPTGVPFQ